MSPIPDLAPAVPVVDVSGIDLPGLADLPRRGGDAGDLVALPVLVGFLSGLDPTVLGSDGEVLELAAAWRAVACAATAAELAAVGELAARPFVVGRDDDPAVAAARARRGPVGEVSRRGVGDEVSVRLADGPAVATARCWLAAELPVRFPAMATALAQGRATEVKARILRDGCRHLDTTTARIVDGRVARHAARQAPSRFRQTVRRAVLRHGPATATERRQLAEQDRQVRIHPAGDGMAELWALLPAEAATRLGKALDSYARSARAAGDERTLEQLRADGLTDQVARSVEVQVVVPGSVLLGLSDDPAELAGYGPVDADLARQLAADATWRRILTDPDDHTLLSAGATTYRPGVVLARHVTLRDQTCRFPTCTVPADRCDLDHTIPFGRPGGQTVPENLGPLCRRHHQYKQPPPGERSPADAEGDEFTRLRQPDEGHFTWTTSTGHRYDVDPPPLLATDDPLTITGDELTEPGSIAEYGLTHYLHGYHAGQQAA